ncbi:MAG: GNAT family N-acetyltransferase, partial [Rubrobacter sp.]|nr:GNAT family N-acetyltransferase [Rubrobacter sp.]
MGVHQLRVLAYPDHEDVRDFAFFDRMYRWYQSHPLADQMQRWISETEDGEVVGHLAAMPLYYRVNGQRMIAHTPGDYMVHPEHGFQALSLMRRFFKSVDNCFACDMVPAVIDVQSRFGADVAGQM